MNKINQTLQKLESGSISVDEAEIEIILHTKKAKTMSSITMLNKLMLTAMLLEVIYILASLFIVM